MLPRPDVTLPSSASETCFSSRIRSCLNWSFRLFRLGLPLSPSSPAISELLKTVDSEALVFRRSVGGGDLTSLPPEEFRESQANGPVSLRAGGGGGAAGGGFLLTGGGAHGTEGRLLDRP